ncbi:hypothetical protein [Antrihabitans sp. YC2-6]|uniref:TetR/AcrR family transcriptional regulator n=1 Tax=Antrihabitans sp. YC2-6 TaxID=2799498 RepID=UPI0018F718D1|nr:hypothetical protein [Antrihabitans sp. YC2-6]MBJ8345531.1 hypothetical protein [Antrihabitans sp. YC2-6]
MAKRDDDGADSGGPLDLLAGFRLPFSTPKFIDKIVAGTANEVGRRTLYVLITTWDAAGGGPFAAGTLGSVGINKAVDTLMDIFLGDVFERLLRALGADDIRMRATLCASQLVGFGLMRYVAKTEPLASADVDTLVDAMAPTLQRYLTGDITSGKG